MAKTSTLVRGAKKALTRQERRPVTKLNPTDIWLYKLFTDNGRHGVYYSGYDLFMSDPPVRGQSTVDSRKVLTCGTNGSVRAMGPDPEAVLSGLVVAHGVSDADFTHCRTDGTFWNNFWGCRNFIENRDRRLPALVIASGYLRNYDGNGGSSNFVWPRIEQICARWNVPLIRMPAVARRR